MRLLRLAALAAMVVAASSAALRLAADAPAVAVKGYVIDSACAFTKDLAKPISKQCATACAHAGSQLVILADDGTIYWPIAFTTPATGQNARLLPFAAEKVVVTGNAYERGGSKAIVISKIEAQSSAK